MEADGTWAGSCFVGFMWSLGGRSLFISRYFLFVLNLINFVCHNCGVEDGISVSNGFSGLTHLCRWWPLACMVKSVLHAPSAVRNMVIAETRLAQ